MLVAKREFDLILFDLDGTLIDSAAQLAQAVNQMLIDLSIAVVDESIIRTWVGNGADKLVQRALAYREISSELFIQARHSFLHHYNRLLLEGLAMYSGVAQTLQRLQQHGYTLALVTNKPSDFVPPILDALAIGEYFSLWLGGNCISEKKPSPQPLLQACKQLEILPTRTLMVGDSENDVLAAKAAGMKVVGLTYGYNYGRPISTVQPDWVFDHFNQLDNLLII